MYTCSLKLLQKPQADSWVSLTLSTSRDRMLLQPLPHECGQGNMRNQKTQSPCRGCFPTPCCLNHLHFRLKMLEPTLFYFLGLKVGWSLCRWGQTLGASQAIDGHEWIFSLSCLTFSAPPVLPASTSFVTCNDTFIAATLQMAWVQSKKGLDSDFVLWLSSSGQQVRCRDTTESQLVTPVCHVTFIELPLIPVPGAV